MSNNNSFSYNSSSDLLLSESISASTTPIPTSPIDYSSSPSSSPLLASSPIVITATTTSPSKLRQVASSSSLTDDNSYDNNEDNNNNNATEFDVYHIPKGYEVLLVPKTSNNDDSNVLTTTKHLSTAENLKIQKQQKSLALSNNSNSSSSWRKRKQNGHIPRPKNCFMAYREHIQHEILSQNPGMNNKLVSVLAAEKWNKESEETKNYWREKAQQLKLEHSIKYPHYKFSPKKKQPKNTANNANSDNNNNSDDIVAVKTSKVIKKPSTNTILTEEMAKNLLSFNNNNNNGNSFIDNAVAAASPSSSLFWGHYRSPSTESICSVASWTSYEESSTTPSTPSLNDCNPQNNYSNERSSSPLRFEACVDIVNNANGNTVNLNDIINDNGHSPSSFVHQQQDNTNWNALNDLYAFDVSSTFNYQDTMHIDPYYIADDEEYDFIDNSSPQQLFNINNHHHHQQQQEVFY